MNLVIGLVLVVLGGAIYAGQLLSTLNWELAQRLGLQEAHAGPLFGRLERWTARWDLVSMWTLAAAGALMLIDHSWWPYAALVGGGVWVDTGGREAAKWIGLRQHGEQLGSSTDQRVYIGGLCAIVALGVVAIVAGLVELT